MKNSTPIKLVLILIGFISSNYLEAQTDLNISTNYQGYNRLFRVHVPPGYVSSQPIPLVFVFHASGMSNSLEIKTRTRFDIIGDTANFISVFPQALLGGWADSRGTPADIAGIDDVGFASFILDTIESIYNIDATRIYAAGMSGGGVFCQRLALQLNYRLAAFASVGSSLTNTLMSWFPPARKVPVLFMNGTSDTRNLYYGGIGLSTYYTMNTDTAAVKWASFDHCDALPTVYTFPDINTTDLSTVTRMTYYTCQYNSEVVLYRINNGGHTWPGGIGNFPVLGIVNQDINGSQEIWSFFKRHRLLSPADQLIDIIQNLGLPNGLENSMVMKIGNVISNCAGGNENAAINQLNAFINQVNAKRGNELTDQEADQLIAFAQGMIEDIENGTADCGSNLFLSEVPDAVDPIQNNLQMNENSENGISIQPNIKKEESALQDNFILACYPNPTGSEITVTYSSTNNFSVKIINLMGEAVLRTQGQNTMDVSQLPNGVYFLQVMDSPKIMAKKILIQH